MGICRILSVALLGSALAGFCAGGAMAKPARCFTTDDGYFACDFRATDRAGSFEISARGYPGYSLEVDEPGFAFGYLRIDGRSIPLAGKFVRQRDDAACWSNPETGTKLCAW